MGRNVKWIVLIALITSCVKPYEFEAENYEKVLVVDGAVHDTSGPFSVRLSYTYPLDTFILETIPDAQVWVESLSGDRTPFTWSESGAYFSPNSFRGEVGESYRLHVELANGEAYESPFQTLIKSPEIDSVYDRYAELPRPNGDRNAGGIQFFIDTHDETGNSTYYRYQWEEAYKIQVPFPATHKLNEAGTGLVYRDENIGTCYLENSSTELIFGTSALSEDNRLVEQPIRYISEEEQMLRERYTILVKQYAINETAYSFYKRLFESNETGGTLFDRQLGSVYGNLTSVQDPTKSVLGFFEVSGVSEIRRFFHRREFDDRLNNRGWPFFCPYEIAMDTLASSAPLVLRGVQRNVFEYIDVSGGPDRILVHSWDCTQCTHYASNVPPDYWIE